MQSATLGRKEPATNTFDYAAFRLQSCYAQKSIPLVVVTFCFSLYLLLSVAGPHEQGIFAISFYYTVTNRFPIGGIPNFILFRLFL